MKVNRLLTVAVGATLLTAGLASAGVEEPFLGLSYEVIAVDGNGIASLDGTWTARIYAELGEGSRLDAVFGTADNPLLMATTSGLYQNALGGNTSADINPAIVSAFPEVGYDSFVTIGMTDNGANGPFPNAMNSIGMNFNQDAFDTADGSWFVTPDDAQGDPANLGTGNRLPSLR